MRNLSLLCILVFALGASAQPAPPPPPAPEPVCPDVDVHSPDLATAGEMYEVSVNVSGGDENVTPTYNWTVSDGMIESGQGTSVIKIDTSGVTSGYITATVEVGGYDRDCSTTDSATTSVEAKEDDEDEPEDEDDEHPPEKPPVRRER